MLKTVVGEKKIRGGGSEVGLGVGGQTDRERGACDSEISIVRGLLCVSM